MKNRLILIFCAVLGGLLAYYNVPLNGDSTWLDTTKTREQRIEAVRSSVPEEIDSFNEDGFTGLMVATSQGDKELAELFLTRGASVFLHSNNKFRYTPLHIAVSHAQNDNSRDLIPIFIGQGALIDATDAEGAQPLHHLLLIEDRTRRTQVLHLLVDHLANINAQNNRGETLLHYIVAAERDDAWMRPVLKAFPNRLSLAIKDKGGRNPEEYALFLAVDDEPSTVLAALRAPLNRIGGGFFGYKETDEQGRTALMFAAYRGDLKLFEEYLNRGATVDDRSNRNETALLYSLLNKDPLPFLKLLLDRGADPNVAEQVTGYTPLHLVASIQQPNIQQQAAHLLIEKGAYVAARDRYNNTVISLAALRNNIQFIEYILKLLPKIGKSDGRSSVELLGSYKNDILRAPKGKILYETLEKNLS